MYIYIYMYIYISIGKFDPTHHTSGVPFLSFQVRTLLEEKHPTPGMPRHALTGSWEEFTGHTVMAQP